MFAEPNLFFTFAESRQVVASPPVPSHCSTLCIAVQRHHSCSANDGHPSRPMGLCDRLQLYGTFLPASADNRLALKQQTWPWTRLLCLRRPGNHCVHCGSAPSVGHVAVRVDFVARSLLSQGGARVPRTWPATRDLPLQAIAADFAVSSCPRKIFLVKLPPRLPPRQLFGSGTGQSERRQSGIIVRLYMRVVRSGIYVDTQSFGRPEVSASQTQKQKVHQVCQFSCTCC